MLNTQVEKELSFLKEERWVMTLSRISWVASSASGNTPSMRKERLKTRSCTLAIIVSSDFSSPEVALSIKIDNSSFVFILIIIYLL